LPPLRNAHSHQRTVLSAAPGAATDITEIIKIVGSGQLLILMNRGEWFQIKVVTDGDLKKPD
jgi:hypothetical protein